MATSKATQQAIKFFAKHAGLSYDPKTQTPAQGKARNARRLARAERTAANMGFTFEWEYDPDGCIGCECGSEDCACSTGVSHEVLSCIVRNADGLVIGSLGGICDPTPEYRRVVEAELALESSQFAGLRALVALERKWGSEECN
jgi:hypothetical protein